MESKFIIKLTIVACFLSSLAAEAQPYYSGYGFIDASGDFIVNSARGNTVYITNGFNSDWSGSTWLAVSDGSGNISAHSFSETAGFNSDVGAFTSDGSGNVTFKSLKSDAGAFASDGSGHVTNGTLTVTNSTQAAIKLQSPGGGTHGGVVQFWQAGTQNWNLNGTTAGFTLLDVSDSTAALQVNTGDNLIVANGLTANGITNSGNASFSGSLTVVGITNSGVGSGGKGGVSSSAINLGSSPYTFSAPAIGNALVWINANVPSTASLSIALNSTTVFSTAASQAQYPWTILLEPGDSLVFTYSGTGMSYTAGYFLR